MNQHVQQADSASDYIGKLLLETGKLTSQQAEDVLVRQQEKNIRFGEAAIELGFIQDEDIRFALSRQFAYPYLEPDDNSLSPQLNAAYDPYSQSVEELRSLRSQLILRWIAAGHKAFAITSQEAESGSSLIAANLAIVFSQLGERTLLIDANLRKPCLHPYFHIENRLGLADILAGRADIHCIRRIEKLLNLNVLTAGTPAPNPQELLARPRFSLLLEEIGQDFDVIILNTAPAVDSADAQIVAARARGVLLVANQHHTRVAGLRAVMAQMSASGAHVLGCVLNGTS